MLLIGSINISSEMEKSFGVIRFVIYYLRDYLFVFIY